MQLYTKNNELTDYGLSCGYIDGRPIQSVWMSFESIKEARRAFKRQCQLHGFKVKGN
jgi:hypothetical protein